MFAADCADGSFGVLCEKRCKCSDVMEVCDKGTGHCVSGCAAGWLGDDCQKGARPTDKQTHIHIMLICVKHSG